MPLSTPLRLALLFCALGATACSPRLVPPSTQRPAPAKPAPPVVSKPAPKPTPSAPAPVSVAPGPNARTLGLIAVSAPSLDQTSARRALGAFRISCPSLIRRNDQSGLTRATDWKPACAAAASWADDEAARFFTDQLEPAQVGDGKALATGYYEPEIAGSRDARPGYAVPIYKRPPELVEIDLGAFSDSLKGKKIRGQVSGATFIPFADRGAIETGALAGRGLELGWAADPVELFFLQIQGSGRLRLPDGSVMRIGYDGQNGRDYTGIGKLMADRGLLGAGQTSMQGIMVWLRAHPEEGAAIMRENRSWVFFREITGAGPIGALGLPVTGQASVATDPAYIPLGAPVLLLTDRSEANGVWIAQDTGGAIKGSNRFDTFWGAGEQARTIAGGMYARGSAILWLPKGTIARLAQEKADAAAPPKR